MCPVLPFTSAFGLAYTDGDIFPGKMFGDLTFTGVPSSEIYDIDKFVTVGYRVYVGPQSGQGLRLLGDLGACTELRSCSGKYTTLLRFSASSSDYLHVVSLSVDGEGVSSKIPISDAGLS